MRSDGRRDLIGVLPLPLPERALKQRSAPRRAEGVLNRALVSEPICGLEHHTALDLHDEVSVGLLELRLVGRAIGGVAADFQLDLAKRFRRVAKEQLCFHFRGPYHAGESPRTRSR